MVIDCILNQSKKLTNYQIFGIYQEESIAFSVSLKTRHFMDGAKINTHK